MHQRAASARGARGDSENLGELTTATAESVDLRQADRLRKTYEKTSWTPGQAAERFATLVALRQLAMLDGDLGSAFFLSRDAVAAAPRPALAALAETNAAAASRLIGDAGAERLQLRRAWDILRSERWREGDEDARVALATFAIEGAEVMPAEARKAVTMQRQIAPKPGSGRASHTGGRIAALEAMAAGRVAEEEGDEDEALDHYERAFALFRAMGYDLRTALVALDLRRLTGDESYAAVVRAVLARAPKAWFAKQFRAGASPVDRLSRAERVVLAHLINGDSAKAIGAKLKRSPYTISNHTRKIFLAFGLNSRGKVIAKCVELGITPTKLERELR